MKPNRAAVALWVVVSWTAHAAFAVEPASPDAPAEGPYGFTLVRTADGELADVEFFFLNKDCATCHPRQLEEAQGAMHSVAHSDPLYRSLAETARREAGDKVYAYCSGCHSPPGVVSGLIPAKHDPELPPEAKAGVTCDVCHQISSLTGNDGPWREPGNASFVLQPGRVKFGHSGIVAENRSHTGEKKDFFAKSEFCASCHTVIHPSSGLRVEHTYGEWKASIYAEKGIQCQDCHMRSVEDAVTVARTLEPVVVRGQSVAEGDMRQIFPHFFVGGNANADRLSAGPKHSEMAVARLKTAARVELRALSPARPGEPMEVQVLVHNEAAGHNLPTGVTELRQMWVELVARDARGNVVQRQGGLDAHGELRSDAIRFGAAAANAAGKETYKLWEMERFLWKRTIPPKSFSEDRVTLKLPADLSGAVTIEARLFYRSAAPQTVQAIMADGAFAPKTVEMATARTSVQLQ